MHAKKLTCPIADFDLASFMLYYPCAQEPVLKCELLQNAIYSREHTHGDGLLEQGDWELSAQV